MRYYCIEAGQISNNGTECFDIRPVGYQGITVIQKGRNVVLAGVGKSKKLEYPNTLNNGQPMLEFFYCFTSDYYTFCNL